MVGKQLNIPFPASWQKVLEIPLSEGTICCHYFLPEVMKVLHSFVTFFDKLIGILSEVGRGKGEEKLLL